MTLPGSVPPAVRNMPPAAFPHSLEQSRQDDAPSQSQQQQQQQQQGPFAMTPQQQEQFALARQMHHFAQCQNVTSPPITAAPAAQSSGTQASSALVVGLVQPLSRPGNKSMNDVTTVMTTTSSRAAPFLLPPDTSNSIVVIAHNDEEQQQLLLQQDQRAATIIQAAARGYKARLRYRLVVQSVIMVQSLVRRRRRRRADRFKLALSTRRRHWIATIQIQNWYKSHSVRKRYQRDLARILMVQCLFRCRKAKRIRQRLIRAVETAEFIRDKWIRRMTVDVDKDDESTTSGTIIGGPVARGTLNFPKESIQCASEGCAVTCTPNNDTVRKERYSLNGASSSRRENDDALDGEAKSPPRKPHHHCHLNEDTLNMLKLHLLSNPGEYLDEDAVAARMLKTERVKLAQLCEDSEGQDDDDNDDDAAHRQAHPNTKDNAFAFDFFKKTVDATRKANPGSVLDKKTLDWLRRAMGLHRDPFVETTTNANSRQQGEKEHLVQSSHAELQNPERGVARSSRIRKRKEREIRETVALDALLWGIAHAEEELTARRARNASTKRRKLKSHRGAVKSPEENPRKRHRSHSRSLPVMTSDQTYEYRQKSIRKPTWTQEDTCDTSTKSPVSSSSAMQTRLSTGPAALPPVLSSRGRKSKELHGLATLAQNFRHLVLTSGSPEIDLKAVVNMLGIPKRRIYDVVNILQGAGFVAKTKERNHFRWVPTVDGGMPMDEERDKLLGEERQLDEWIQHRTASVQEMKRKYMDGITRAQKRARTMVAEKRKQEDTAAVRVIPPPVKPVPNPITPTTTDTMASAATPPTPEATSSPGGKYTRKLHCLATLAQRFQQVITSSNTLDIDLQDVVRQLGIPKRRIYDVVNVLTGAGVMRRTSSNKYHWISRVGVSPVYLDTLEEEKRQLKEEERQLKEEERQLDEWIRTLSSINGEILARRSISPIVASSTSESS